MQQTTNYNLNLIEKTDEILNSIDAYNENFKTIDEKMKTGGGGGNGNILTFSNITLETTAWVEDTTYEEFSYKAEIPCTGVTADFFSDVTFGVAEALSGNYAPISLTGAGTVTIYAVEQPKSTIIIPSIICSKGA